MRYLVAILGGLVAIGLLFVSMAMNFQFGWSLGRDPFDAAIYGAASVCGDGLKVVLPFAIGWAWSERRRLVATAGAILFVTASAYSLTSALGFAALNRAETAGAGVEASARFSDLSAERERLRAEREGLRAVEPAAAIEAALIAARHDRIWARTSECTDATLPESIAFCAAYYERVEDLAVAQRTAEIEARLAEIRVALQRVPAAAASGAVDPQVSALSELLWIEQDAARLGLLLLVTLFVELGSGLGLYVSMSGLRRSQSAAEAALGRRVDNHAPAVLALPAPLGSDDRAWTEERLIRRAEMSTALTDLYADYQRWCEARGRRGISSPGELAAFLEAHELERVRLGGREVFRGVTLSRVVPLRKEA